MSQRLSIGYTEKQFYDCVVTENSNSLYDKLKREWLSYGDDGHFLGPWKIRINDIQLFYSVQPTIKELFENIGRTYPDDIWYFYYGENSLEHPEEKELKDWLEVLIQ